MSEGVPFSPPLFHPWFHGETHISVKLCRRRTALSFASLVSKVILYLSRPSHCVSHLTQHTSKLSKLCQLHMPTSKRISVIRCCHVYCERRSVYVGKRFNVWTEVNVSSLVETTDTHNGHCLIALLPKCI
jgi:hypothetical protein